MSMSWSKEEQHVVDELRELSPFHLSQEERHEMWQNIRRRMPKQKSSQRVRRFAAAGVVAAACALLVVGAVQGDWLHPGGGTSTPKVVTGGDTVDFQVGFDALYEVQGSPTAEGMQATVAALQQRLDQTGLHRAAVTIVDPTHIRVQTTADVDSKALSGMLTQTAKLEFKAEDGTVLATGMDVKPNAAVTIDPQTKQPQVQIEFKDPNLFKAITEANIGHHVSIWLDNHMLANPMIQTAIANGKAVINGFQDESEAKAGAGSLNNAALPYPLVEQSVTTTGK